MRKKEAEHAQEKMNELYRFGLNIIYGYVKYQEFCEEFYSI